MKEGDDPNGQNDRTDLDPENQLISMSPRARESVLDLIRRSPYRPAASECRISKALQKTALDHSRIGSETSCATGGNHRRNLRSRESLKCHYSLVRVSMLCEHKGMQVIKPYEVRGAASRISPSATIYISQSNRKYAEVGP